MNLWENKSTNEVLRGVCPSVVRGLGGCMGMISLELENPNN